MPWYLPRLTEDAVCDPWTQQKFSAELGGVAARVDCNACLADCEYTEYSLAASAAAIRSGRQSFQR